MSRRSPESSESSTWVVVGATLGVVLIAAALWFFVPQGVRPSNPSATLTPVPAGGPATADARASATPPSTEPEPEFASGQREVVAAVPQAHTSPVVDANAPPARLIVRVVDFTGTPVAGVEIEWVVRAATGQVDGAMIRGTSDAHGLIAVDNADRYLDACFGANDEASPYTAMIQAVGLRSKLPFDEYQGADELQAPGVLWLTAEPQPGVPVELKLPPSGFVRFEWEPINDAAGEPIEGAWLSVRRSDGDHFPGWRTSLAVTGGAHVFGPVGLGWEVFGSLAPHGVYGGLDAVRAPGPMRAGETVTVRIPRAAHDLVRIHGRVTNELDEPMTRRVFIAFGDPEEPSVPQIGLELDPSGAFDLQLPRAMLHAIGTAYDRWDERKRRTQVALDVDNLERHEFDLGTIVLEPQLGEKVLLASGRVTDPEGKPLQRATVTIDALALSVGGEPVEDPGTRTTLGYATTDKHGEYRFEALCELADGQVRVRPSIRDYLASEPRTVPAGSTDVDFALVAGLSVTLDLQFDPWAVLFDPVAIRFTGNGRNNNPSLMDFYGHYQRRFSALEPGTYRIEVRMRSSPWVLWEREVVVVGDQDLGVVDLRGALRTCALLVVDADGQPVAREAVSVRDAASGRVIDRSARTSESGHVHLLVPTAAGDLTLAHPELGTGTVPASLFVVPTQDGPPSYATITLRP